MLINGLFETIRILVASRYSKIYFLELIFSKNNYTTYGF
jgi:hypothetical protein